MRMRKAGSRRKGSMPRVAFFDRGDASYIISDLRLLEGSCSIRRHSFMARKPLQLPWAWVRQLIHCLSTMWRTDIVFVQFAGWNSFIPLPKVAAGQGQLLVVAPRAEDSGGRWVAYILAEYVCRSPAVQAGCRALLSRPEDPRLRACPRVRPDGLAAGHH